MFEKALVNLKEQLLTELRASKEVYLTGSRFFGGATPQSDWDFFTRLPEPGWPYQNTVEQLLAVGFSDKLSVYSYSYQKRDRNIKRILTHPVGIDLQLVVDAQLRLKARDFLAQQNLNWTTIPKEDRSDFWNAAEAYCRAIKNCI